MDTKIGIHFGTTYDGKGSRQLQNGINQAGGAIARLKNSIKTMGSGIGSALKSVGSNLMNIKSGFDMLIGVVKNVGNAIKDAFDMARLENNFKFLIGSADKARQHMEMLYELGMTPPFGTKEFASASKTMMLLTNNVLGGKDSMVMLGDAADGVGVPIETLAENVGYFYAMLRDGEPISRASKQLVRMGAISPEVAAHMKKMQEEGKPLNQIWATLTTSLNKFNGSMDNTAKTTGGKIEELKSRFERFYTSIGQNFARGFESQMESVNKSIDKVSKNSSWDRLSERIGRLSGWLITGKMGEIFDSMLNAVSIGIDKVDPPPKTDDAIEDMIDTTPEVFNTPAKTPEQDLAEAQAKLDEKFNKEQIEEIKKVGEKLTVDQEKIATNNRKAVEEEMRAQEEAANKERKRYYNDEMESRENLRNTLLTQIRNRLENIHEQQKKQKFYIDASNGGNDGINNWGQGNRPTDENGNFLRPEHADEADRDAARGKRNIDAQRIGPNRLAAMQQQYDDLKKKIDKNIGGVEGLSDRDRKKYNQLKRFFDPEEPKLKDAADQIKKQDLTQINTTLGNIKTLLENSLNIK